MKSYDEAYFSRWYRGRRAAVSDDLIGQRARLALAAAEYVLAREARTVLDVGCGEGRWRAPLRRARPGISYQGVDGSEYAVRRYGRRRNIRLGTLGGVGRLGLPGPFDLVVCYDVLQYLDDRTATRALANLARLTRGVLYLSALTARDWRENCDRTRTDRNVFLRDVQWYGQRLRRHFRPSGVGFWVRRGSPLTTWEMETAAV